jgi:hypothetical protein
VLVLGCGDDSLTVIDGMVQSIDTYNVAVFRIVGCCDMIVFYVVIGLSLNSVFSFL